MCGLPVLVTAALVMLLGGMWLRLRRWRETVLLRTLALLMGQNLPLVEGLTAAAAAERGRTREMLESLRTRFLLGDPLSIAVRITAPSLSTATIGQLATAERMGTLPTVLHGLSRATHEQRGRIWPGFGTPYMIFMTLFVPGLVLALTVFLVPKYRDIFADFGIPETRIMHGFVVFSRLILDSGIPFVVLILLPIVLVVQFALARRFMHRGLHRSTPLEYVGDALAGFLPVLRTAAEARAMSLQLPLLATALRAGHDLPEAAELAAITPTNCFSRRRLRRWAERIRGGAAPKSAAAAVGFRGTVRRALESAERTGELAASLDYLAAYYASLYDHRIRVLRAATTPLFVLFWGSITLLVLLSIYGSLLALIDSLVSEIY
ncbi:MAG: type II secretion system F family protein [Planctomycetes bacterium]|nr:type II secretion system F family protein [Planctomycetota bacterium]